MFTVVVGLGGEFAFFVEVFLGFGGMGAEVVAEGEHVLVGGRGDGAEVDVVVAFGGFAEGGGEEDAVGVEVVAVEVAVLG